MKSIAPPPSSAYLLYIIFFITALLSFTSCIYDPDELSSVGPDAAYEQDGQSSHCQQGHTFCGDPGDGEEACVSLLDDPLHCGACHNNCSTDVDRAVSTCSAGFCDFRCEEGLVRCGDECVDVTSDRNHCGGCHQPCRYGQCEQSQCLPPGCDDDELPFGGGEGTADSPYTICATDHFDNIALVESDVTVHLVLTQDLDVRDAGQSLRPVDQFLGTFDAMGHRIYGFELRESESDHVGLFRLLGSQASLIDLELVEPDISGHNRTSAVVGTNHGTIDGVHVTDASIDGNATTAIIAGRNFGTIVDTTASGDVLGRTRGIGGLVGMNDGEIHSSQVIDATISAQVDREDSNHRGVGGLAGENSGSITDSTARAQITTNARMAGGLVGVSEGWSTIRRSHSEGSLTSTHDHIGGLVGFAGGDAVIINSSSDSAVFADDPDPTFAINAGGLVGSAVDSSQIVSSHASGDVQANGEGRNIGGLVGRLGGEGRIVDSFASGDVDGGQYRDVGGLVGITADFSQVEESYASGDVSSQHHLVGGLIGQITNNASVRYSHASGDVTVDASDFVAVGGLAGRVTGSASLEDSYATGDVEAGSSRVGGLVGDLLDSDPPQGDCRIENSHASGDVVQLQDSHNFGGLLGLANGQCQITNSYATGNVDAPSAWNVGGLVGYIDGDVAISQSFATGDIDSYGNGGGLVGCVCQADGAHTNASIRDSFATGDASGLIWHTGGLVGIIQTHGDISRCYATGTASLSDPGEPDHDPGGLIGGVSHGDVYDSYWDLETSGTEISAAGQGLQTSAFSEPENFGDGEQGWDFESVWFIPEESDLDDLEGADVVRPRHRWEIDP